MLYRHRLVSAGDGATLEDPVLVEAKIRQKETCLPLDPLISTENSIDRLAPWDTDATIKTYVNSVDCDPLSKCIEGYDSFSDLTLDWWKGR